MLGPKELLKSFLLSKQQKWIYMTIFKINQFKISNRAIFKVDFVLIVRKHGEKWRRVDIINVCIIQREETSHTQNAHSRFESIDQGTGTIHEWVRRTHWYPENGSGWKGVCSTFLPEVNSARYYGRDNVFEGLFQQGQGTIFSI